MFSTAMGHNLTVRVEGKGVSATELPAVANAVRGGFVVDTQNLKTQAGEPKLTATLHGLWGFTAFDGPSFSLRDSGAEKWTLPEKESSALVAGHTATVHIQGDRAACVEEIALLDTSGKDWKPTWKVVPPNEVEIELPLKEVEPGPLTLAVTQFGQTKTDTVALQAYSDAVHLEHFRIFAGDAQGALTGTHLEEVTSLELDGVRFAPMTGGRTDKDTALELKAEGSATGLKATAKATAKATLKDGRTVEVASTVEPPRPKVRLVSKNIQAGIGTSTMRFAKPDALPQDAKISFFVKSEEPAAFSAKEKIEIATTDGGFSTTLSLGDGSLVQQDVGSVLALFEPLKAFGPAAFGPLQFRAVEANGGKGDWRALAMLVRVPVLKEVRCPDDADKPCSLKGTNLFLLDAVAADSQFKDAVKVPAGYVSDSIEVPRPYGTRLYIKLRDDSEMVATVALPVLPDEH